MKHGFLFPWGRPRREICHMAHRSLNPRCNSRINHLAIGYERHHLDPRATNASFIARVMSPSYDSYNKELRHTVCLNAAVNRILAGLRSGPPSPSRRRRLLLQPTSLLPISNVALTNAGNRSFQRLPPCWLDMQASSLSKGTKSMRIGLHGLGDQCHACIGLGLERMGDRPEALGLLL